MLTNYKIGGGEYIIEKYVSLHTVKVYDYG